MPSSASPRRSPRTLARRSPSPNLYGGRRSPRRTLNRAQARRVVSLIVSIMIALALARVQNRMSPEDARKYGGYVIGIFRKFLSIVTYCFAGYEREIEAGAAAIATVIGRKFSSGTLRLNSTNLMIGVGAYTVARHTGSGISNFINQMNKKSNSWWQWPGTQAALNEKIRTALITMLAWMISSLNFFAVTNVGDMIRAELRHRGILGPSRRELENAGRRALRIR